MKNLLGLDREALENWVISHGERPFRARQLMQWIHQRYVSDFSEMTDISRAFQNKLKESAVIQPPKVIQTAVSKDGTTKWGLQVDGGKIIESVFIPEDDRGTLCVSTQIGCIQKCPFCFTGQQGFTRNLSTAEIIGQLWSANSSLGATSKTDRRISNVVLMGMGEPLANYNAVLSALKLMLDDLAYGLSRRRVTVSTSGVIPAMDRLKEACPVSLAVSLHAPNDELRNQLVPMNKKYPLKELIAACNRYLRDAPKEVITFEYVMLGDVNDDPRSANELIRLLSSTPSKINLIPFNPYPGSPFKASKEEDTQRFAEKLIKAGFVTTVRKSRGSDILAACGQLAGQVEKQAIIPAVEHPINPTNVAI